MKIINLVVLVFLFTIQVGVSAWYNQNQGEVNQYTNIVKNGTITSLVTTSNQGYYLTGAATQVIKLPDATTLPQDWWYSVVNTSSGTVTIRDYQDNNIATIEAGRSSTLLLRTKSTGAGTWYQVSNAVAGSSSAIDYNSFSATAPLTYNGSGVYGIPVASGSSDGYLSAADWNTFNNIPSTFSATAPLVYNGAGLYSMPQASGTTDGYLSAADWTMFNNSATGNFITDLTGDVTATGPNSAVATIANNAVTDGKFRQSAGLSVVGRSSNSTGDVADITAAADGDVLRRSGTTLDFGDVTYASLPQLSAYRVFGNPTGSTADAQDSTLTSLFDGAFSSSVGSILYRGAATWDALAPGTAGRALVSGGSGAPSYYTPTVGSVLFAGTGGVLSERNNSFFWDDTNLRLGIGSNSPTAILHVAGSRTGTPSTNGSQFLSATNTFTDSATAVSGTAAAYVGHSIGTSTLTASNTSVTTTSAQTLRVSGPVVAGTNETITSSYGIYMPAASVVTTGAVTNAYGLSITSPTGATNNYAATFTGGNVGMGTAAPTANIHSDRGNATASALKFTAGTTTGTTSTDGYEAGIDTSGNGEIRQRENLDINIFTNNSQVMKIENTGEVGVATTSPGSTFHVAGSFQTKVNSVSANTTLDATYQVVLVDDSGATRTISLPACASAMFGREYRIKKMSASNTTVIDPNGAETIDGAATLTLSTQYDSRDVICTSAGAWNVF